MEGGLAMNAWQEDDLEDIILNPFYAVNLDPMFAQRHVPLVSEQMWIDANARMLKELGPEAYLRRLLDVLKGQPREGVPT